MSFSITRWPQHNGFPNRVARRSARHLAKHKAFHMFFGGICRTQATGSNSSSFLSIRWPHLTPAGSQNVWPNEQEKGKPNILVFICFFLKDLSNTCTTHKQTLHNMERLCEFITILLSFDLDVTKIVLRICYDSNMIY